MEELLHVVSDAQQFLHHEEMGQGDPKYRLSLSPQTDNEIIVRDYRLFYDFI
jgi:hypothetical protein